MKKPIKTIDDAQWVLRRRVAQLENTINLTYDVQKRLTAKIAALTELVNAVKVSEFSEFVDVACNDVHGTNWFDRRDELTSPTGWE
jgi:hypothetical protein